MEKNTKQLIMGISFVAISIGAVFIIDYFQTQNLLKNGTRCNAVITGRFYEVSSKNDTSSYSIRLRAVPDTSTSKGSFLNGDVLNAYVKKEIFYKYGEGSIVNLLYHKQLLQ